MPAKPLLLLSLALAASSVLAMPAPPTIKARSVISHDAVVGFAEAAPDTAEGRLMLKYKPFLKVVNGCVPFPAVDSAGNTGGGLKPTGSSSSGCSSSTGQVYARAATYENYFAIMYSWYFPKDEPSQGLGHRHDWEEAIAWLSSADDEESATLVAWSVSAHGGISTTTTPGLSAAGGGGAPLAAYVSHWPLNHQLDQTDTVGGTQPLVAWDSLTDAARTALESTDFGSANVPCKDAAFVGNLEKGYASFN